jgi:hypothetical protein
MLLLSHSLRPRCSSRTLCARAAQPRRVVQTKWNRYLRTKTTAAEDRNYESINHIVKLDWYETDVKRTFQCCCAAAYACVSRYRSKCVCDVMRAGWGGFGPHVTVEYDESTGYLLWITVRYNKREANKCALCSASLVSVLHHTLLRAGNLC